MVIMDALHTTFDHCERACHELAEELIKFYAFSAVYLQQNRRQCSDNSADESDEGMADEEQKDALTAAEAKRRALKVTANAAKKDFPSMDEPPVAETRVERRAKRRALRSSLVEELRAEMAEEPERVNDRQETIANRRRADAQRRFEEANFVRLSGGEKKRQRLGKTKNGDTDGNDDLRQLLAFGRYRPRYNETADDNATRGEFRTAKSLTRPGLNGKISKSMGRPGRNHKGQKSQNREGRNAKSPKSFNRPRRNDKSLREKTKGSSKGKRKSHP